MSNRHEMQPPPFFPENLTPRVEAALRSATEWIDEQYSPVGLFACGSLLRGEGGPTSDLDLYVIHKRPWKQRTQRYFGDVPAEVFVNTPASARAYLTAEVNQGRPVTAHMLATGFVVIDRDPVIATLRAEAQAALDAVPPFAGDEKTMQRFTAASLLDDARDVAGRGDATAALISADAIRLALRYFVRERTGRIPRDKDLVREAQRINPDLSQAVKTFFEATSEQERLASAEEIVKIGTGTTGFFDWESEKLPTSVE